MTRFAIYVGIALCCPLLSAEMSQVRGTECVFPDMSVIDPVPLEPDASDPAGAGGEILGGRWQLFEVRYRTEPFAIEVEGNARSVLELDAAGVTGGQASLALEVTITSPPEEEIDEVGAGPYSANGILLSFQNDCGDELTLDEVEYSIDSSMDVPIMTLWGDEQFDITEPFPTTITVFLEVQYELVEPQQLDDPVFDDRFEVTEVGQQALP